MRQRTEVLVCMHSETHQTLEPVCDVINQEDLFVIRCI